MPRRSAFTLIELLVVIGILVILIALMLPSLMAMRRVTYLTHCAANLHHVGLATGVYSLDNRGNLPLWYRTSTRHASYWMLRQQSNVPVNLGLVRELVPQPQNFYCITQNFVEENELRFDSPDNPWPWDGDTWKLSTNATRLRSSYYARFLPGGGSIVTKPWKFADYSNKVIYTCFSAVDHWAGGGIVTGKVYFPHFGDHSNGLYGDGAVHRHTRQRVEDEAGREITAEAPNDVQLETYYEVMDRMRYGIGG